jgi:hypothetical protein
MKLPDYHQKHHGYHHMGFQVCGMKDGPQTPKVKMCKTHCYHRSFTKWSLELNKSEQEKLHKMKFLLFYIIFKERFLHIYAQI